MLASLLLLASATPLLGDFDLDGRPDRAYLRQAGTAYELVIERADGAVSAVARVTDPETFYFEKLPAGTYKTACAKDEGKTKACPRRSITVRSGTLQFGTTEASQAAAVWKDGRFAVYWLAD